MTCVMRERGYHWCADPGVAAGRQGRAAAAVYLLGLAAVACTVAPARAAQGLAASLLRADRRVSSGTVAYRVDARPRIRILTPAEVDRMVREKTEQLRNLGSDAQTIREETDTIRRVPADQRRGLHQVYAATYTYTSDGRFSFSARSLQRGGPTYPTRTFNGRVYAWPGHEQIVVYRRRPEDFDSRFPMMGFAPGPCFPMGRGLSGLRNLRFAGHGELSSLFGTAPDGSAVNAVVDPHRGFVATQIDHLYGSRGAGHEVWNLSQLRRLAGVWMPGRAVSKLFGKAGGLITTTTYTLLTARFGPPKAGAFTIPLANKSVIDRRLGTPFGFRTPPPGVHTLAQALDWTRKQEEVLATIRAEQRRRARWKTLIRVLLTGLLVASLAAFAWALRRRMRTA